MQPSCGLWIALVCLYVRVLFDFSSSSSGRMQGSIEYRSPWACCVSQSLMFRVTQNPVTREDQSSRAVCWESHAQTSHMITCIQQQVIEDIHWKQRVMTHTDIRTLAHTWPQIYSHPHINTHRDTQKRQGTEMYSEEVSAINLSSLSYIWLLYVLFAVPYDKIQKTCKLNQEKTLATFIPDSF